MKLENQVCTESQGYKLEQLGVSTDCLFCYCMVSTSFEKDRKGILPTKWEIVGLSYLATTRIAPAYTAAELGIMINWDLVFVSSPYSNRQGWVFGAINDWQIENKNETIGRGDVLIYLLESRKMKVEEVNKALLNF